MDIVHKMKGRLRRKTYKWPLLKQVSKQQTVCF
jgi:hypothetical protein